ncbi:MAG: hypothetical protein QG608_888 [Actinomycetota bacterium]|nr:hypothetical protein [Actinomycetota bacterium]
MKGKRSGPREESVVRAAINSWGKTLRLCLIIMVAAVALTICQREIALTEVWGLIPVVLPVLSS